MIQSTYRLSPSWNRKTNEVDLGKADEGGLRYDVVLGDIILTINDQDFSAEWGWVPLLDFAVSLTAIVTELEREATESVFEFTESDAALHFERKNTSVLISSNYSVAEAGVQLTELRSANDRFRASLAHDVIKVYPQLAQNELFRKLMLLEMTQEDR